MYVCICKLESYMRRTKDEAEETKKNIVEAAVELFEVNGYEATRIEDIAERAGLTRGAVYWHFKTKIDLYSYIFTMFEKRLDKLIAESEQQTASPISRLRWFIVNMITRQEILLGFRQMKIAAMSNFEFMRTSNILQKKGEKTALKYMKVLAQIVTEGIAAGEVREDVDPVHAAWLTAFFVAGAIGINLHKQAPAEMRDGVLDIVDLFLKGIVTKE